MALSKIKSDSIDSVVATKLTGTVDNARITLDAAEIPNLDAAKITTGTVAEARLATLDATKLTGNIANARIPSGAVTQHVVATDLTPLRQDIAMLALYNAVSDNRAAYNLPSSFIDQFEDDTGVTTQTDVDNVSEYFATVYTSVSAFTADSDTVLLVNFDTDPITDSSASPHTLTHSSGAARVSDQSKFGGYSGRTNSGYFSIPSSSDFAFGTGDFTIEFWMNQSPSAVSGDRQFFSGPGSGWGINIGEAGWTSGQPYFHIPAGGINSPAGAWSGMSPGTWFHYAISRASGTMWSHSNGTRTGTWSQTGSFIAETKYIGKYGGGQQTDLYMDELRVTKGVARYGSGNFTPNQTTAANATGTLISDTQTASSATTKMSGVILYKDNAGTATLGTDLVISLSANGGTNWTNLTAGSDYTLVTAPFSTGVRMVKLTEKTVTSGTAPVMKAVWANQASGSKETQLHGWAMNF